VGTKGRCEANKNKGAPLIDDKGLIISIGVSSFPDMQGQFHSIAQALLVEDATDVTLYCS
jgi:hypothetical protein